MFISLLLLTVRYVLSWVASVLKMSREYRRIPTCSCRSMDPALSVGRPALEQLHCCSCVSQWFPQGSPLTGVIYPFLTPGAAVVLPWHHLLPLAVCTPESVHRPWLSHIPSVKKLTVHGTLTLLR